MEDFNVRDGRGMPVFIHSELDDYGLSCVEFRVYARLARRSGSGTAFESVPRMAADFEVSDRTVQRALRVLVRCRLISEERQPGRTTRYTLNPREGWIQKEQLKVIRADVANKAEGGDTTLGGRSEGVTPETGVGVTPERDEGTPVEGTPQIDITARENFLPEWLPPKLWARWIAHLTQKGKPVTVEQMKAQIGKLKQFRARGMPPAEVVENSIEHGWQGFFELKQRSNDGNGDGRAKFTTRPDGRTPHDGRARPSDDRKWAVKNHVGG